MKTMTLKRIKELVAVIKDFLMTSNPGETKVFLSEDELENINGISEELFMTHILGDAVIVHYSTSGDWTKALLITKENLDYEELEDTENYDPADEALEWFFS